MNPAERATFRTLSNTPLHEILGAERRAFEIEMARWLVHEEGWVREAAVERLATAIIWKDLPRGTRRGGAARVYWTERLGWLFGELEAANRVWPGVIQSFVDDLRFRTPSGLQIPVVLDWFDGLERDAPPGLDPAHILGARIVMMGEPRSWREEWPESWDTDWPQWVGWLDHESDWVRGCAAYRLGNGSYEESEPSWAELRGIVSEKEIARPGIAGPFWSQSHFDAKGAEAEAAALWMFDLLERRQGPVPAVSDMPYNDIAFYLHELCAFSPEDVDRMLRGGFVELALMTATEMREPVESMKKRLERLARVDDPEIARRAANHLAAFYR